MGYCYSHLLGARFGIAHNVSVALNDGTGHFARDIKSPVLDGTVSFFGTMVAGNFRNTGLPDLIVVPNQFALGAGSNVFSFVPNAGAGHFGRPVTTAIAHPPGTLAVGDFNGDGKLDFVMVGTSGASTPPQSIHTFLGNGDGTFIAGPGQGFVADFTPFALFVGDVNGDGKLDVLVPVNVNAATTLIEFLGNGDGSFAPARTVISEGISGNGVVSQFFAVADLNHDGRPDVVVRSAPFYFDPPQFKIYLAQPDGSFLLTNTYSPYSGQNRFGDTLVADFNGDGNPDIAALQIGPLTGRFYQVLLGNGDGSFVLTFEKLPLSKGGLAVPNIAADMNGDGKADFVELDGFSSTFNVISSSLGHPFRLQFSSLPVIGSSGAVQATLAAAAVQDSVLQLSSSDPAITLPGTVTIPEGSLSASAPFTVPPGFDHSRTFTVTASDGINSSSAIGSVAVPGAAVGLITGLLQPPFNALLPGQSSGDLIYFVSSRGGYQSTVTMHCEGLPPGVACQFGATSLQVAAGGSNGTSLVLAVTARLPLGSYTFNIVTSDSSISQSLPVTFKVGDFTLQFTSAGAPALPTGFENFSFIADTVNGFNGPVNLSCTGLPLGATCPAGFTTVGALGPSNSGVTVSTTNVAVGDYPFVITGDTGFTQHGLNAILHVGDFGTATIKPAYATLNVGQSATFALTLSSVNGFADPFNLSCVPTVNELSAGGIFCSFSPSSGTFDASRNFTGQLTVNVTARPRGRYA